MYTVSGRRAKVLRSLEKKKKKTFNGAVVLRSELLFITTLAVVKYSQDFILTRARVCGDVIGVVWVERRSTGVLMK